MSTASTDITTFASDAPGRRPGCPRCGSPRVTGWGRFHLAGRDRAVRRYRCAQCDRTFSEYTGSPVAGLKKRHLWPAFCDHSRARHTVRGCARRLGVHRNTAFRWRHRLLHAARTCAYRPPPFAAVPALPLQGRVVVGDIWFYFSEKGKRPLGRPPYTYRPRSAWLDEPRARLVLALDDDGRVLGDVVGLRRPNADMLEAALRPHIAPPAVLLSREGRFGAPSVVARRLRLAWQQFRGGGGWPITTTRPTGKHARAARDVATPAAPPTAPPAAPPADLPAYIGELRRWLRPLKGVATRYLPNYVAWHQLTRDGTKLPDYRHQMRPCPACGR
jgi:transposase-like protein